MNTPKGLPEKAQSSSDLGASDIDKIFETSPVTKGDRSAANIREIVHSRTLMVGRRSNSFYIGNFPVA